MHIDTVISTDGKQSFVFYEERKKFRENQFWFRNKLKKNCEEARTPKIINNNQDL
jgi:hypothetical protein